MPRERRESVRLPIPWDQSIAFLRKGRVQYSVQLIDTSRGGFAITCPERLTVNQGDLLRLRTSDGWFEVRVVNIKPLEEGAYPAAFDCSLGVLRLRDLHYGPDDEWVIIDAHVKPLILAAVVLTALLTLSLLLPQSRAFWRQCHSGLMRAVAVNR